MAKKRRRQNRKQQHAEQHVSLASYKKVIAEGQRIAEKWDANWERLNDNQQFIYDYYSRPDIQDAMFAYAKGRKISVLRVFRTMYNRIEEPQHILFIALYHADHKGVWPSIHGMISRHVEETNQHLCDFVIEVDKMRRKECFQATLPYIKLLRDFGIYSCVKFSGHVSAHVIIPGESFPTDTNAGSIRKQFVGIENLHRQLMDYVQKIIKHPEKLDRYFLKSNHFLRLAYSMNERTGLVSVPISIDEFERFSWQNAETFRVDALEDWWRTPPEDAQERMQKLLDFTARSYHVMQEEEAAERRQKTKVRTEHKAKKRAEQGRQTLKTAEQPAAVPHATELSIPAKDYQQMLETARAEQTWCEAFLARDGLKDVLLPFCDSESVMSLHDLATQQGCTLDELWRVWHWLTRQPALEHYAKSEVQGHIFQASEGRRLRFWGEDLSFQLQRPEDIYPLAVFQHLSLGMHEYPAFVRSVARYRADAQFPFGYELVVEVNGRGQEAVAAKVATEVKNVLSSQGLTFTAYHDGLPRIYLWVQIELQTLEFVYQYTVVVEEIRKAMRHAGIAQEHWRVLKRDAFAPVLASLNLYTGMPCR